MKDNNRLTDDSALNVMGGITSSHDGMAATARKRFVKKGREIPVEELSEKIVKWFSASSSKRDYASRKYYSR